VRGVAAAIPMGHVGRPRVPLRTSTKRSRNSLASALPGWSGATSGSCIVRACRCPLRVFTSSSSWRLGKSPDLASLDPGYVHVACASTRQSWYFHCKEQARNNGPLVSATGSLHRHPRMQERRPIACRARPPGRIPALAFLKNCRAVVSCISLFFLQTRQTRGARLHTRRRNKKPGAVSRPGGWRTFGEYTFLEDSRYTSQEIMRAI
jgi:hypothetical protein